MVFGKGHHNFHVPCFMIMIESYSFGIHIKTKKDLRNKKCYVTVECYLILHIPLLLVVGNNHNNLIYLGLYILPR